eukprot:gene18677-biopygen5579
MQKTHSSFEQASVEGIELGVKFHNNTIHNEAVARIPATALLCEIHCLVPMLVQSEAGQEELAELKKEGMSISLPFRKPPGGLTKAKGVRSAAFRRVPLDSRGVPLT